MADLDKAIATQLANIQKKTGKSLDELYAWLESTGLRKHGELRDAAKTELGLGHRDANTLVTLYLRSSGAAAAPAASPGAAVDEIYVGAKAALRPVHDRLMTAIESFGPFDIAPKKSYLSLRRKKQFVMIGPKTNTRFEVGINAKDLKKNARLLEQPKGSMCNYIVNVTDAKEVDSELVEWIKTAYEGAE